MIYETIRVTCGIFVLYEWNIKKLIHYFNNGFSLSFLFNLLHLNLKTKILTYLCCKDTSLISIIQIYFILKFRILAKHDGIIKKEWDLSLNSKKEKSKNCSLNLLSLESWDFHVVHLLPFVICPFHSHYCESILIFKLFTVFVIYKLTIYFLKIYFMLGLWIVLHYCKNMFQNSSLHLVLVYSCILKVIAYPF